MNCNEETTMNCNFCGEFLSKDKRYFHVHRINRDEIIVQYNLYIHIYEIIIAFFVILFIIWIWWK